MNICISLKQGVFLNKIRFWFLIVMRSCDFLQLLNWYTTSGRHWFKNATST